MRVGGSELSLHVYVPDGEGPFPVVVAFHGVDSLGNGETATVAVAEAAARAGMVVFAPSWIVWDPSPFPVTIDTFTGSRRTANCAIAYAQQHASDYGGDPATTVAYGFSGGAGAALLASVAPAGSPIEGCASAMQPAPVSGVVLGDGPYFLHDPNFDEVFATDPQAIQAEVADLVDLANWPATVDAAFFLCPENGTAERPIGDASDAAGWLGQRDPDGSIRADLGRLGELDDGVVSNSDAARLLELRLKEAGFAVTLDVYPGGHTTLGKVPQLIGYLEAAAAR